jgi:hypothetical protein
MNGKVKILADSIKSIHRMKFEDIYMLKIMNLSLFLNVLCVNF